MERFDKITEMKDKNASVDADRKGKQTDYV